MTDQDLKGTVYDAYQFSDMSNKGATIEEEKMVDNDASNVDNSEIVQQDATDFTDSVLNPDSENPQTFQPPERDLAIPDISFLDWKREHGTCFLFNGGLMFGRLEILRVYNSDSFAPSEPWVLFFRFEPQERLFQLERPHTHPCHRPGMLPLFSCENPFYGTRLLALFRRP